MNITLTLGEVAIVILGLALLLLLIYLIIFIRNASTVMRSLDSVLQDAKVVSSVAAKTTAHVEDTVEVLAISLNHFSEALKGNQSIINSIASLSHTLASIQNIIKNLSK